MKKLTEILNDEEYYKEIEIQALTESAKAIITETLSLQGPDISNIVYHMESHLADLNRRLNTASIRYSSLPIQKKEEIFKPLTEKIKAVSEKIDALKKLV